MEEIIGEEKVIDLFFILGVILSLLIGYSSWHIAQTLQHTQLGIYGITYITLSLACLVLVGLMLGLGYELGWEHPLSSLLGGILTLIALIVGAFFVSPKEAIIGALIPQAMGVPIVKELAIPEGIRITGALEFYVRLSEALKVKLEKAIAILLCFPAGWSETLFQAPLPTIFSVAMPRWLSHLISSTLFGFLHSTVYGLMWGIGSFILSLVLAGMYELTKNMQAVSIAHFLYDALIVWMV